MADTPDISTCADRPERDGLLNPFLALNYHFGMLLGVDDFATEQGYHQGKMRLHNAWLHRAGVVWGFGVNLDVEHGEVRMQPGLALDGNGRELHLDADACVNVVEWYLKHKDDTGFSADSTDTRVTFDARVEIRFRSCLTRQVPALLEPCDGGATGTAYSRVFETVDIQLLPQRTTRPPAPYHRLRVLFALTDAELPADQPVLDARNAVLALASDQQPAAYLEALRQFAALDEIDLKPPTSGDDGVRLLFPEPGDAPVVLANITGIALDRTGPNGALKLTGGVVDVTVRPSHIATATIQELLCGPLFQGIVAATPHAVRRGGETGPHVLPKTVSVGANEIRFQLDRDLQPKSVTPSAFSVSAFTDAAGWTEHGLTVSSATDPPSVSLKLKKPLAAHALVRIIAKGTGPEPLLGANLAPLAGSANGSQPPLHDGLDFVFMQVRS